MCSPVEFWPLPVYMLVLFQNKNKMPCILDGGWVFKTAQAFCSQHKSFFHVATFNGSAQPHPQAAVDSLFCGPATPHTRNVYTEETSQHQNITSAQSSALLSTLSGRFLANTTSRQFLLDKAPLDVVFKGIPAGGRRRSIPRNLSGRTWAEFLSACSGVGGSRESI